MDPDSFEWTSFVTTLSDGNEFEEITLSDDQILHPRPCNPDFVPAEELELIQSDMTTSQIRNDGVVVGSCTDWNYSQDTNDYITYGYGFIATPME